MVVQKRMADTAAWYSAMRTLARPPRMWRMRMEVPLSSAKGAQAPPAAAMLFAGCPGPTSGR